MLFAGSELSRRCFWGDHKVNAHKCSDDLPILVNIRSETIKESSNRIPKLICQQGGLHSAMGMRIQRAGMPDN